MTWWKETWLLVFMAVLQYVSSTCPTICDCYYDEQLEVLYNYQSTLSADCRGRSLKTFPRDLDIGTKHLYLSSNNFTKIQNGIFENLHVTGFYTLDFSSNKIHLIGESAFKYLTELQVLHLDNNFISSLDRESFRSCNKLRYLSLRGNPILLPENKLFLNVQSLETLDLSQCNLSVISKTLLQDASKLQVLKLSNNNLLDVNILEFTNLRRLELDFNMIPSFQQHTFRANVHLVFLSLSNNALKVTTKSIVYANSIQYLYLNKCGIEEITETFFVHLNNLEELYMDWNSINKISNDSFRNLENVRVVSLRHNNIKYLLSNTFKMNVRLSRLDLSGNNLSFGESSFPELPSLIHLSLSSCNFSNLNSANTFTGLGNLQTLSLANNNLATIDLDVLDGLKSLQYLDMSNNPLKCNQHLQIVWKWCKKRSTVCSAECRSPRGDWNMLQYLEFGDSEYNKDSSRESAEEPPILFLAIRCIIPSGSLALLIGMVFLVRRLINFASMKTYYYSNSHYSYESEDSDIECPYIAEMKCENMANNE